MDDTRSAVEIMSSDLVGRELTRVLLDFAVTLQFWSHDQPAGELKFEEPFDILNADGSRLTVNTGRLADAASHVAALHMGMVAHVDVLPGDELRLGLPTGGLFSRRPVIGSSPGLTFRTTEPG